MTLWQSFLAAFGGTSALLLLLIFFGRSIVGLWLNKDLERYKADLSAQGENELALLSARLQSDADSQLAKLRAELQASTREREVVFTSLHAKRSEIVAKLYATLGKAITSSTYAFTHSPDQKINDLIEATNSACRDVYDCISYFDSIKIWLSEETCQIVDDLLDDLNECVLPVANVFREDDELTLDDATIDRLQRHIDSVWPKISSEVVPPAKLAIEREFRRLVGVLDPKFYSNNAPTTRSS